MSEIAHSEMVKVARQIIADDEDHENYVHPAVTAESVVNALSGHLPVLADTAYTEALAKCTEAENRLREYEQRWETEWEHLKEQWEDLKARVLKVGRLHSPDQFGHCRSCHRAYPCPTMQALGSTRD